MAMRWANAADPRPAQAGGQPGLTRQQAAFQQGAGGRCDVAFTVDHGQPAELTVLSAGLFQVYPDKGGVHQAASQCRQRGQLSDLLQALLDRQGQRVAEEACFPVCGLFDAGFQLSALIAIKHQREAQREDEATDAQNQGKSRTQAASRIEAGPGAVWFDRHLEPFSGAYEGDTS